MRKQKPKKTRKIKTPKNKTPRYCRYCGVLLEDSYFFCSNNCQKFYSDGARIDGDWLFLKNLEEDIDFTEFLNQY